MKKNNPFILFLLFASFVTSSCNKTWYCECKSRGVVVDVTPIKSLGKMGAKNVCDSYQDQNNANGASQVCVLK